MDTNPAYRTSDDTEASDYRAYKRGYASAYHAITSAPLGYRGDAIDGLLAEYRHREGTSLYAEGVMTAVRHHW